MRIISLAPDVTETLYLLGAQDRLIGNTTWCNWPEAAKQKSKIGDLLNPNYEVILAAKPDLVIASTAGNQEGAVLKLATGTGLRICSPPSVPIRPKLGRITDCAAQGALLHRADGIGWTPCEDFRPSPSGILHHLVRSSAGLASLSKMKPSVGG
jgi:hypothetical protein